MSVAEDRDRDIEMLLDINNKIERFKVIQGGKGGTQPPNNHDNWLINLSKGCVFSCKENGKEVDLDILRVVFKHEKTVIVADALNSQPARAVDPEGFCKRHKLFEILEEGGEHPKEVTDGNSTRTL